ncbi:sugar phosphate nucleotidyltransferase [Helicobacter turcicus]|uniref:NTP transferase domain-containing protein n=1 Tax=Helicobacter turcicus TaxID=2867412 RepID=A0ABS7JMR9_9HELI|nr:sugar phosphate nucleotidyltransferase [Helicobacter turcicus]MBX7490687.1 NTP transferase domain-containing protein [Helicobacter turcicus]MBX7545405.1 NTP transferase domain-containing protein [Helicobacter turcicus]
MRAIILCAGKGTRLQPLTLNKPKPLLEIKGKSLLENAILHLRKCGVEEIIVVTGYKHSLFDPLAEKLKFQKVVFEHYASTNSAASLKYVQNKITKGTFILNGDLFLTSAFQDSLETQIKWGVSQFLAQKILHENPSWGYITDENCKLLDIDTNATNGYGDGIAFFDNAQDLSIIKDALAKCEDTEYWEACILKSMDKIDFYIFGLDSLYIEIDSFNDALISKLITPEEIAKQCADDNIAKRLFSVTNINYKIKFLGEDKVIRIPRTHRDVIINTKLEQKITKFLGEHITPQAEFYPSDIKLTTYLQGYQPLKKEQLNFTILEKIVNAIKTLHSFKHKDYSSFPKILLSNEIKNYESLVKIPLLSKQEHKYISQIVKEADLKEFVLCHRDLQLPNILYNAQDSKIQLIDFEFAGFCTPIWEMGNLAGELELNREQICNLLTLYPHITYKEILQGKLISSYVWALWSWYYDCITLGREYLMRLHYTLKELQCNL